MKNRAAQLLLLGNLAVFTGWGLGFLAAPKALAALLGIALTNVTAVGDVRAMYGGLCLAVAVLFFQGLRGAQGWVTPAVWIATLGCAGLAVGRIATFATEGATSPILLVLLASELGALALGVYALLPAKAAASPTAAALPR